MSAAIPSWMVAPPANDVMGAAAGGREDRRGGGPGKNHPGDGGDPRSREPPSRPASDFRTVEFAGGPDEGAKRKAARDRVPCSEPREVDWVCGRCSRSHYFCARCEHWQRCAYCHALAAQGFANVYVPVLAKLSATHRVLSITIEPRHEKGRSIGEDERCAREIIGAFGALGRSRVPNMPKPGAIVARGFREMDVRLCVLLAWPVSFSDQDLIAALRQAGKVTHPNHPGDEDDLRALLRASILTSERDVADALRMLAPWTPDEVARQHASSDLIPSQAVRYVGALWGHGGFRVGLPKGGGLKCDRCGGGPRRRGTT
jgi:hypothetical protein